MKWKVGDQAIAKFKKHDGSMYCERGVVARIWGKIPYAVTFVDSSGPIRIGIKELFKIPRRVNLEVDRKINLTLPAVCSPGRSRNAGRRKPGSRGDTMHETKAGKRTSTPSSINTRKV